MGHYKGNSVFKNGKYISGSKITDQVCDLIGWSHINALKTMFRGEYIYVRATLLKPHEIPEFQRLDGMKLGGAKIKIMNFRK